MEQSSPESFHQPMAETSLLDLVLVIAEHLRLVVAVPLCVGLVALGVSFLIPPTYTATTKLLPPQQQQGLMSMLASQLGALAGPAAAVAGVKNPSDVYVAMLKSRTIADRLIERFGLHRQNDLKFNEQASNGLRARTRVTSGRDGLIVVTVDDPSAERAAALANAYVEELSLMTQEVAITEASQRRVFFERHLKNSRDELMRAEVALRKAGINEATLNVVPSSAIEFVANLKARVTAQEIKLAVMRGSMTESSPEFMQASSELAAMRAQLAKAEQNDQSKAGERGAEYIPRLRNFKYHEALFEMMAKQYELARLDEAREGAVIQVIDKALPPQFKSKPNKTQIAVIATLVAFFLTVLALFALHAVRRAVADPVSAGKLARLRNLLRLKQA
ncbi:MAG TPA: Wzz/FepE/Etk N-terminal domain-containing protein [Burkholderiales bacterium]|nr:Wzz/FepE/Etk N-terminal domain-containing protein [Burkholderiales bacterium]